MASQQTNTILAVSALVLALVAVVVSFVILGWSRGRLQDWQLQMATAVCDIEIDRSQPTPNRICPPGTGSPGDPGTTPPPPPPFGG
ncbi:MAG TPA: hypothetical protein VGA37_11820 [Gemmatimonadales bacterium]